MPCASGTAGGLEHSHEDTHAGSARIPEYLTCAHVPFVVIKQAATCGGV